MNKQDLRLKKILHCFVLIYIITILYAFYYSYKIQDMNALAMGVVAIITPCIVPALFKLFRFKPVYEVYIMNIVFVYFASLIGSTLHGYSILGFDKALHFSSGLLLCIASILVFMIIKKVKRVQNKEDYALFLVFINALNLAIAAIWEFYEYAMLIFFNNDCINHYSQGVHDSMTDMLCALVGGFIITGFVVSSYRSGKSNFVMALCEKFYVRNIEPLVKK